MPHLIALFVPKLEPLLHSQNWIEAPGRTVRVRRREHGRGGRCETRTSEPGLYATVKALTHRQG